MQLTGAPKAAIFSTAGVAKMYSLKFPVAPPLDMIVEPEAPPKDPSLVIPKSGLLTRPLKLRYFGTLRCHPVVHSASRACTNRGAHDLATSIKFSKRYKRAMAKLGKSRKRYLSPRFGEWLMGFPQGWTSTKPLHAAAMNIEDKSDKSEKIPVFDAFTGCCGLGLGASNAFEPVAMCELDTGARKVLKARMDDKTLKKVPIFKDIKKVTCLRQGGKRQRLPRFRCLSAGFPCQDVSTAGRQLGLKGSRTVLIRHVVRLLRESDAPLCILENVAAIRSRRMHSLFRYVLKELQKLGYELRWVSICAKHVGSPQGRERWIALGVKGREGRDLLKRVAAPPNLKFTPKWNKHFKRPPVQDP